MEEERSFRAYVTDSLKFSGEHKYLSARWIETVVKPKEDSRTADEIAVDVIKRLGLIKKKKGGGK